MKELVNLLDKTFHEFLILQSETVITDMDSLEENIQKQILLFRKYLETVIETIELKKANDRQLDETIINMEQFLKQMLLTSNIDLLTKKIRLTAIETIMLKCEELLSEKISKNYMSNIKESILSDKTVQEVKNLRVYGFDSKGPSQLPLKNNSIEGCIELCENAILNKKYYKLFIVGTVNGADVAIKTIECPTYQFENKIIEESKEDKLISENKKTKIKKETTGIRPSGSQQKRMYH